MPGCDSCVQLGKETMDLEERISILHQIKDDEELIDSLVTVGLGTSDGTTAGGAPLSSWSCFTSVTLGHATTTSAARRCGYDPTNLRLRLAPLHH